MKDKDCAKEIAVLAQESNSQFDFTVEQIVKMGRYPYKSIFEDYSKEDLKMVKDMLKKVGLDNYSDRSFYIKLSLCRYVFTLFCFVHKSFSSFSLNYNLIT